MKQKRLLFVGGMFPDAEKKSIEDNSRGHIHYAANVFQWNLIEGFEKTFDGDMDLLTAPFIGSFPFSYKKALVKSMKFSHCSSFHGRQVGFCTLYGIKPIFLYYANKKVIRKWILKNMNSRCYILFYSAQVYYLRLAKYLKEHYPNIHLHLIIPDLPAFMDLGKTSSFVYHFKKRSHEKYFETTIGYFDSYTLLTFAMAGVLGISPETYVVVEGICKSKKNEEEIKISKYSKKRIVYTGTLTRIYGIMDLIEAFQFIDDDGYELVICGEGETKAEVIAAGARDNRIKYIGRVSHDEAEKIQREATILVNTRKNAGSFTKFSFPSKLIEYLSSGRPVLCYRLDGIPKEYDDYLNYIDGSTPEDIAKAIKTLCGLPEAFLNAIGAKGADFVKKQKNSISQTKRIVALLQR